MSDWSKIHELDRKYHSENPWVTIGASVVLIVLGVVALWWAWHMLGATLVAAQAEAEHGTGRRGAGDFTLFFGAILIALASFGATSVGGGVWWIRKGVVALRRGERVAK